MKFLIVFFLSSIILVSSFVGLIVAVDPYEKLGNNFFNLKTKAVAQSRENKFRMLESSSKKYEAFILGSSAAHRYPTHKVEELTGLKTYNYAVQHSTPIDYLAITKHILSKHKPKLILLQLDFAAMDSGHRIDNRLYNSPLKDYLESAKKSAPSLIEFDYFTIEALIDSLRVFKVNYFGEARHIYAADGNYVFKKVVPHKIKIKKSTNANYIFSQDRLDKLLKIQQLANEKNFSFKIITAPISIGHLNEIFSEPILKQKHEEFIRRIKESFPSMINFQTLEIEKYKSYEYFLDSAHPTKKMSEIILESIF